MPKDLNSTQSGIHQEADVNNPSVRTFKGKNLFPQSFVHPSTCQYGYVDPVAFAKCEVGDIYNYKFVTDLNTFTLSSPLKSKVKMYTSAFKVPMEAIYPRNWDIMLPIPNKGDDVPEDTRAILPLRHFVSFLNGYISDIIDNEESSNFSDFVRIAFLLESLFSAGGIFSKCNLHLSHHSIICAGKYYIFDDWFDKIFCSNLKGYFESLPSSGPDSNHLVHYTNLDEHSSNYFNFTVTSDPKLYGTKSYSHSYYISFERAIELLRSGDYSIKNTSNEIVSDSFDKFQVQDTFLPNTINIEPIIAYQLSCAHFFNNPKVDFIYSAQLYRDNLESLINEVSGFKTFNWNGINKLYDVFSQHYFEIMLDLNPTCLYFWSNLFNFQYSLRYGDYFTGSHPEPIAPGDIDAPVIDNSVNAIDMTKKLQMARLLNKVNITGPRIADYIRSVLGGSMPEAPSDVPIRLSKESFDIGGFEVNNTGDAQLSDADGDQNITTTNLRLDDSRYMFEVSIDKPCWIVVVQYFEAHRIYSKTMDRFAFHFDRFDDFVPDLQYIGDQDVKSSEIDSSREGDLPFAYNLRYMEYKQRYSYASGGFINKLKSWAFVTDNFDGNPATAHITPEYIRSSPTEFDRFYKNLSGYSLGTRFHFITFNTNVVAPYRQMVFAPEILN